MCVLIAIVGLGLLVVVVGAMFAMGEARIQARTIGSLRVDLGTPAKELVVTTTLSDAELARAYVLLVHDTLSAASGEAHALLWEFLQRRFVAGGHPDDPTSRDSDSVPLFSTVSQLTGKPGFTLAGRICREDELSYRVAYALGCSPTADPEAAFIALRSLLSKPSPESYGALCTYVLVASGRTKTSPGAACAAALAHVDLSERAVSRFDDFAERLPDLLASSRPNPQPSSHAENEPKSTQPTIAPDTWQLLIDVSGWVVIKLNAGDETDPFSCLVIATYGSARRGIVIIDDDATRALRSVSDRVFRRGAPSAIAVAVDSSIPDGRGGYIRGILVRLQDSVLARQLEFFGPTGFAADRRAQTPGEWVLLGEKPLWTDLS